VLTKEALCYSKGRGTYVVQHISMYLRVSAPHVGKSVEMNPSQDYFLRILKGFSASGSNPSRYICG
jgi:hypothetical protein